VADSDAMAAPVVSVAPGLTGGGASAVALSVALSAGALAKGGLGFSHQKIPRPANPKTDVISKSQGTRLDEDLATDGSVRATSVSRRASGMSSMKFAMGARVCERYVHMFCG